MWYWRLSSSDDETNKKENNTLSALNLILIWHSYSFTFILFFFSYWQGGHECLNCKGSQRLKIFKTLFIYFLFFMERQLCFSIKCFWVHCSGEAIYLCPCQNLPECLFQSFAFTGWTDETCCWVSHLQIRFLFKSDQSGIHPQPFYSSTTTQSGKRWRPPSISHLVTFLQELVQPQPFH